MSDLPSLPFWALYFFRKRFNWRHDAVIYKIDEHQKQTNIKKEVSGKRCEVVYDEVRVHPAVDVFDMLLDLI